MKWYPYGHDFGNAQIGGVTVLGDGKSYSCSIPTAFAKADISAMLNLGISMDQSNTHIMQFQGEAMAYAIGELALQQAALAVHVGEVPIGAVLVHNHEVIAAGHNRREIFQDPTAHAEMIVIRKAAERLQTWRLTDTTL